MIKFGSNNIITGFIKQLLHDFNLPSCPVNPDDSIKQKLLPGVCYIEKNSLYQKLEDKTIELTKYFSGSILPDNLYSHLIIRNANYDTYTHEYLGEYLRFLRDYHNLDLMPLYNCFSNNLINISYSKTFDTAAGYKVYAIPVKFFKEYTLAIDCFSDIEIFCGYYNNGLYELDNETDLYTQTHVLISNVGFNKPVIYDKLLNIDINGFDLSHEQDLRMFLKLPITNTSSISILEGNYLICANQLTGIVNNIPNSYSAQIITNFEEKEKLVKEKLPLNSRLQLLSYNSNVSYPFADKLIGYLLNHYITNIDDIPDNKARLKKQLASRYPEINKLDIEDGDWSDYFVLYMKDFMQKIDRDTAYSDNQDILGYFDKDVEKYFKDVNIYTDW